MKILCLGNNNDSTDIIVNEIALKNNSINHGLINSKDFIPEKLGYYHTTITDLTPKQITSLAEKFDEIILLDQPNNEWSHWKIFLSTYKLAKSLNAKIINKETYKGVEFFSNLVQENKSFCIYPFIELIEMNKGVNTCTRSNAVLTKNISDISDWKNSEAHKEVRQKMLAGERLPNHCSECYKLEDRGIESWRQFETMEWVSKLGLTDINDLKNIDHPYYYEIRLSNKCNIMCRSCKPEHSHLIDKEYQEHKIHFPADQSWTYSSFDHVDISKLNNKSRIYLTGGEPSVVREFYDFMENCIENGNTDFDFTIGTNAASYTPKFWELISHFKNMNFSISVDGFGKINNYQRWLSDFDTMMSNAKKLKEHRHNVTFLVVPGMYNVTNLHLLFEYFDKEWPNPGLYVQVNHNEWQSAFNHPNSSLVIESMEKCMQTNAYLSDGYSCKSTIDAILNYYKNNPTVDKELLKQFFDYNDRLDESRGVRLIDYIPELEEARKFL